MFSLLGSPYSLVPIYSTKNCFPQALASDDNIMSGATGLTLAEENALVWKLLDQNESKLTKANSVNAKINNKLNKLKKEQEEGVRMIDDIMLTIQEKDAKAAELKDVNALLSQELAESHAENTALKREVVELSTALEGSQVEIATLKEDVALTSRELLQTMVTCITLKEEIWNVSVELEERKSKVAALREERTRLWKRLEALKAPPRLATIMEARAEEERPSKRTLKTYLSDTESTRMRKKCKSCEVAPQPRNFVCRSAHVLPARFH